MTINTDQDDDLAIMQPYIKKVRTAIKGSPHVKMEGALYLPSPNQVDLTSPQAKAAYSKYLAGAEFDEYTKQTQSSMIGKLSLDSFSPELPDSVEYLINDTDGNGTSLRGMLQSFCENVLAVKWHVAAVDYQGLQGLAAEDVSIADAEELNPRATIKQYSRESVVKAYFSVVNGVKQLSFIMLQELTEVLDPETYTVSDIYNYIILALDEDGNYYQQKIVSNSKSGSSKAVEYQASEKEYVTVGGEPLKFIPLEFVADEEISTELPQELGFLNPIAEICYYRYNASADYKEALRKFVPTTNVFGLDDNDLDDFEKVNGRRYYAAGQVNVWPKADISVQTTSSDGSLESFEKYDEESKNKIRSIGGVVPEYSQGDVTATEAMINAGEQTAVLNPLVNNIEVATKKLISYCAMFEGAVDQDSVSDFEDEININLPRDFAKIPPDVEAGRFILEMKSAGTATIEQAVKKLVSYGWHEGDVETILAELEDMPPALDV